MASQDKGWQTYYERAWEARADFMRQLLRDGCNGVKLNAQQIIGRLRAKERLEEMQIEVKGRSEVLSYGWQPREFMQKNKSFIGIPCLRQSALMGREVSVPFYTDGHEDRFLIDIIDHSGPYDAIVELGCGYGANLFDIFYHGGPVDIPYYGGEFTASGEQIARELATAAEGMRAEFFHFNV